VYYCLRFHHAGSVQYDTNSADVRSG
jgi:hypothetical protein